MIAIFSLENTLENKIFIVKSSDHRNVRKRGIRGHRGQEVCSWEWDENETDQPIRQQGIRGKSAIFPPP